MNTGVMSARVAPVHEGQTARPATLGKAEFLQLLAAQLKYQHPMKPMNDRDRMVTQWTALGETTQQTRSLSWTAALSLLGLELTYHRPDGLTATGVPDSVMMQEGDAVFTIGNVEVALSQVIAARGGGSS